MGDKREELLQEMDMELARQKDRIEAIQDKETKKDLEKITKAIEELHFKIQMDDGLKVRSANKRMNSFYSALANVFKGKYVKNILLAFIAGIILTLIPTILYISSLKGDNVALPYVPNRLAYRMPTYVQIVKTQEQVEKIKKANIRDKSLVSIGSAIKLGSGLNTLNLLPAEEIASPNYHIKDIGIQKDKIRYIDGYKFAPDGYFTKDPIVQLLTTESEVEMARKRKNLNNKDLLQIGAAITCPSSVCFVTAKSTLEKEYEKVIPLSEL